MNIYNKAALLIGIMIYPIIAEAQLIDNDDGTITDTQTDLMWLQTISYGDWNEANTFVNSLNNEVFAGYDDWRLPSPDQPYSLGEIHRLHLGYMGMVPFSPPFINFVWSLYWTSTEDPTDANKALAYLWDEPSINGFPKNEAHYFWPVRTIPDGAPDVEVDVWIKDHRGDDGSEPSSASGESYDIFIDNNGDGRIDIPRGWENPQSQPYSYDNTVKAWVRNKSDAWVNVWARLYTWNCVEAETFTTSDFEDLSDPVLLAPNTRELVVFRYVSLPNWAAGGGDWCLGVVVSHAEDQPSSLPVDPREDNNIATASTMSIFSREGEDIHGIWLWYARLGGWVQLVFIPLVILIEWLILRWYYKKHPRT